MSSYQALIASALAEIQAATETAVAVAQAQAVLTAQEGLAALIELNQLDSDVQASVYAAWSQLNELEVAA